MLCIRRVPTMLSIHQDDDGISPTSILRAFSSKGAPGRAKQQRAMLP
jgi:hypothetical protein